jgi:hypothetical protein
MFGLFSRIGTNIDYIIHKAKLNKEIAMEIYEFLKAGNEINKANEMAFRYAASILEDFKNLTPAGRSFMVDTLMNLISGEREEPDIKTTNLKGWRNRKIRNINGTSQKKCNCGSWLKHWEKFSMQTASFCPVENCLEMDLNGAHVQKDDSKEKTGPFFRSVENTMQPKDNHLR